MFTSRLSLLSLLVLAVSGLVKCAEERPKNAPANAIASCVIVSRSCRKASNYTGKKGDHGIELVFNQQPNFFVDNWHNFISSGHYKSSYWVVSDDKYFMHTDAARTEDLVEDLLNKQAHSCNAAPECHTVEDSNEDGFLKKPKADDKDDQHK